MLGEIGVKKDGRLDQPSQDTQERRRCLEIGKIVEKRITDLQVQVATSSGSLEDRQQMVTAGIDSIKIDIAKLFQEARSTQS